MQQRRRITAVRQKPTLAVILTVALIASGVVAGNQIARTQSEGIGAVSVLNESESFGTGTNVLVDDPAISTQGEDEGARTVKEFQREDPFSMFALTWQGEKDVTAFVRAEEADGSWSQWYDMDPQAPEQGDTSGTNGTELIFLGQTSKIQVSTHNVELFDGIAADETGQEIPAADAAEGGTEGGAAYAADPVEEPTTAATDATDGSLAPLPSNYGDIQPVADTGDGLNAVFIDGNADAGIGGVDLTADSDGMPSVVSRASWGADESLRCSNPTVDDHVSAITIHHTAGSNNYTAAESAAQMRGIYNYHAKTLGWCDVGYQSLVDKYGTIYEGRAGGMTRAIQGAHAGGFNQNTWAISMMGDYSSVTPSDATINAVGQLAGWRAKVAGFDPKGQSTHYSEGTSYSKYSKGTAVTLPNIFAHRDVGTTTCPGDSGYAQMSRIRDIASAKYASLQSGSTGNSDSQPSNGAETTTPTTPTDTSETTPTEDSTDILASLLTSGSSAATPLLNGANNEQILTGIGSMAAIAIAAALNQGSIGSALGSLNGVPILENLKLNDIIPIVNTVIDLSGENKYSTAWNDLNNVLGPVLGNATGGETTVGYASELNSEVSYVPFENGIIVSSPEAGTHGLWGVIGDTWTQQGADLGPLGLPINQEYLVGNLIQVDFQGGSITFNPATGEANIELN